MTAMGVVLPDELIIHKLNDMCEHCDISLDHHKADGDSHAAAEIFLRHMMDGVEMNQYLRTWKMTT